MLVFLRRSFNFDKQKEIQSKNYSKQNLHT